MPETTYVDGKVKANLSFDSIVMEAVDNARGTTIDRSRFVNDILWFTLVATDEEQENVLSFGVDAE